jgi:hypothetical protein
VTFNAINFKEIDSIDIYLNNIEGVPIVIIIEKDGQIPADKGDNISAKGMILIGNLEDEKYIPSKIQFGNRLTLLGETLTEDWGYRHGEKPCKFRAHECNSDKWATAFEAIYSELVSELNSLFEMCKQREEALRNA